MAKAVVHIAGKETPTTKDGSFLCMSMCRLCAHSLFWHERITNRPNTIKKSTSFMELVCVTHAVKPSSELVQRRVRRAQPETILAFKQVKHVRVKLSIHREWPSDFVRWRNEREPDPSVPLFPPSNFNTLKSTGVVYERQSFSTKK